MTETGPTATTNTPKPARELFDDYIKTGWPNLFRGGGEVHVKKNNGARYVPTQWAVSLLKKDVNAWDEALAIWGGGPHDSSESTQGWDRIVQEAGVEYTWEWALIDPARPWASEVPQRVRENIEMDLRNRKLAVAASAEAKAVEAERRFEADLERRIENLNNREIERTGKPLTEERKEAYREQIRARRAEGP